MSAVEDAFAFQLTVAGIPFVREYKKAIPHRRYRFDFFIEPNLLIEIQGGIWHKGGHSTGTGITRDCEKLNLAQLHGYRNLAFTSEMVEDGTAIQMALEAMDVR